MSQLVVDGQTAATLTAPPWRVTIARRELVFGGQFGDSAEAQLTPVAVVSTGDAAPKGDCFAGLHVRSIEEPDAEVIIVRDADVSEIGKAYANMGAVYLDRRTYAQVFSPVPNAISSAGEQTQLFPNSPMYDVGKADFLYPLLRMQDADAGSRPRQFADAVAVAGVQAACATSCAATAWLGSRPIRSPRCAPRSRTGAATRASDGKP